MVIPEAAGRPNDLAETVSDLVQGFAVLARVLGSSMPTEHAFTLQITVHSLLARAEKLGWEESHDLLRAADDVLNLRIAPPR